MIWVLIVITLMGEPYALRKTFDTQAECVKFHEAVNVDSACVSIRRPKNIKQGYENEIR